MRHSVSVARYAVSSTTKVVRLTHHEMLMIVGSMHMANNILAQDDPAEARRIWDGDVVQSILRKLGSR